jgi:TRAP-type C4-dicarboxylate transport system permease small subunit
LELPTGRSFLVGACGLVVVAVLLRLLLQSRPAGKRLRSLLHGLEGGFLAALLAAMIVFSFLQVVLRNVANTSFLWIDPLLRHLVLWVGLLGAMLASRIGRHINVDALGRLLHGTLLRLSRITTNLLASGVCLFLAHACFKLVRDEIEFAREAFLGIPIWKLQLVMPVATLIMSSRFLGHAVDALRGRDLKKEAQPPEVRE